MYIRLTRLILALSALLLLAPCAAAATKAQPIVPPRTAFVLPPRVAGGPTHVTVLAREVLGGIVPASEVQYVVPRHRPRSLTYIVYVYSTASDAAKASGHLVQPGSRPLRISHATIKVQRAYDNPIAHEIGVMIIYSNVVFAMRTAYGGMQASVSDVRGLLDVGAQLIAHARTAAHAPARLGVSQSPSHPLSLSWGRATTLIAGMAFAA